MLPHTQTTETSRSWKPSSDRARRRDGVAVQAVGDLAAPRPAVAAIESADSPKVDVRPRERSEIMNRLANLIIAGAALCVLAPLMFLIGLLVRLTSRGPALYKQERVGIDRRDRRTIAMYDRRSADAGGSVFTIYKFRTMTVDAEATCGAVWATPDDPRVTQFGRYLRRTRLDELPQLFNVLKGDMNIVGPRPERPSIFADLRENISEYPLRQRTKPGITGLAQINNQYDATLEDVRSKVQYDLEYLGRQSLWEDIKIMVRTIPVMLFKRSGW